MKARLGNRTVEIDERRVAVLPRDRCADATAGAKRAPVPPYRSKLEADYANHLELLKRAGEIIGWWYEPINFRLPGQRNFYKPDFLVQRQIWLPVGEIPIATIEIHEVKGWSRNRREGITKLKTSAGLNPWATFSLVTYERGHWRIERMRP